MVGHHRPLLTTNLPLAPNMQSSSDSRALSGLPFTKMTGSGNDFVFFDGRVVPLWRVNSPEVIQSICNRYNGIGADGVVLLEPESEGADVVVHYFNSDGTPADLCGNATLCSTALSAAIGLTDPAGMKLATGAGLIRSRLQGASGVATPEIDLQPVTDIRPEMAVAPSPGELRIGFAVVGIPHLVILCADADAIDLASRGPALRWHESTGPAGANVNWVSARPDGRWRYRTFERGVEGETLACGTGAVATALLLSAWVLVSDPEVTIRTSSGRDLTVHLTAVESPAVAGSWAFQPRLRGEGRIVYRGVIEAL